mmetsp:Transcript_7188/g.30623  ORF Transcript_7188/g.30623 Transcript_7188/m.30623 type:complete len:258 (-) Transcript_7188:364-1137(-)
MIRLRSRLCSRMTDSWGSDLESGEVALLPHASMSLSSALDIEVGFFSLTKYISAMPADCARMKGCRPSSPPTPSFSPRAPPPSCSPDGMATAASSLGYSSPLICRCGGCRGSRWPTSQSTSHESVPNRSSSSSSTSSSRRCTMSATDTPTVEVRSKRLLPQVATRPSRASLGIRDRPASILCSASTRGTSLPSHIASHCAAQRMAPLTVSGRMPSTTKMHACAAANSRRTAPISSCSSDIGTSQSCSSKRRPSPFFQ